MGGGSGQLGKGDAQSGEDSRVSDPRTGAEKAGLHADEGEKVV